MDEGDDVESRVVALVSREPMVSSSAAVFRSGTGSEEKDYLYETRYAGGDEEEKTEEDGKGQPRRPLQVMGANNVSGGGIERLASSAHSGERSPCREQQRVEEVPPREREEEEIVALSRYLAYAGREWPWVGKAVLWAEYVSLSGHHRSVARQFWPFRSFSGMCSHVSPTFQRCVSAQVVGNVWVEIARSKGWK